MESILNALLLQNLTKTEVSSTTVFYLFLLMFIGIVVSLTFYIRANITVMSTIPNILRIQTIQAYTIDTFWTPYYKPRISLNDFITRTPTIQKIEPIETSEKALVNFAPLTVTQPGFMGPLVNGVFDEKNGVTQLIRAGVRCFVLSIDYHEEPSMKPPLYADMNMPCLLCRDSGGTIRSLNSGSIEKVSQIMSDTAFSSICPSPNDPLILILHFVRTPDKTTDQTAFLRYCSQVAKELAPLTQYHLGQTPQGSYNRQSKQDDLLYTPLREIEKKVLIFSNLDTRLFRTVKPSYSPKEDLDFWVHLRLYKDSTNSLGVTQNVTQNQMARGLVDTVNYFSTIPPENVATMVDKTRIRWSIALSDTGTNPSLENLTTLINTIGVQCVPLSIVNADDREKALVAAWKQSSWLPKKKPIRFTVPSTFTPAAPSPKLNANQGKITSPSL